jgi:hypothetical protein
MKTADNQNSFLLIQFNLRNIAIQNNQDEGNSFNNKWKQNFKKEVQNSDCGKKYYTM